jgi:ABC-type phosphate transport system substrate-binding protein
VVHRDRGRADITAAELIAVYRGEVTAWPDGAPVVPLVRQADDSTSRAIAAAAPALAEAMRAAGERGRALVRYTDQDLRDSLLAVPGAIGFLDAGTLALERLPLVALRLDGAAADPADPAYPLVLTLSVLTRAQPTAREAELVDFLTSAEVARELAAAGYAPVTATAPAATPGGEPATAPAAAPAGEPATAPAAAPAGEPAPAPAAPGPRDAAAVGRSR